MTDASEHQSPSAPATQADQLRLPRPIVLVGMMGAGKTTVGRRLAARLGVKFVDADAEIERAAALSIRDIFDVLGESAFRDGERRVIERLFDGTPKVIATGGGAFMDETTRALVLSSSISVWLKADVNVLVERTARRNTRPLLESGNRREILTRLARERETTYAQAAIHVATGSGPHDEVVNRIIEKLDRYLAQGSADA